MDKFLIRSNIGQSSSNGSSQPSVSSNIAPEIQRGTIFSPPSNVDSNELESRGNAGDAFTKDGFKGWNKGTERFRTEDSEYKGVFLELLEFHGDKHSDVGKIILHKAPKNDMMICPAIQKDIVDACAKETIKAIIQDLNDDFFGILVDESKDTSHKEQMALIIRYVNKRGEVIEQFLGIVHVNDTSTLSLQKTIYDLLLDHSLSSSKLRGQGCDGASNMKEE
ncbi:uncharacterized protein LOC142176287 [Nicotiana tabacum]|uniref:Uncharacterized protein LOC142176287 n=1 Tax=Nicotiana tabacum TaxID=4097 RepID=A0AC58TQK9_TOBAC